MSTTQETPVSEMPATTESAPPVRKNVRVRANAARAFRVFTEGLDSWWPKAIMEGRVGGRCYSDQEDGTQCDWGQILVWEPPTRFVMAWQVTPTWQFEPDVAKCSEVEVTFTPSEDGTTWVELEHRHFERHGDGGGNMRNQVDQPGGWGQLMELFRTEAERPY
jgi:hypothetical protein